MPIAVAVGGGIGQELAFGAAIAVCLGLIVELRLAHHAGLGWGRIAVAGDAENVAVFETLGDAGCGIAGIQPDSTDLEVEALTLAVQPVEIDDILSCTLAGVTWVSVMIASLPSTVR
ncbi:hypothetical protein GGE12_002235 [Rhizobium mongolense]|uniref:Uncharacterized protein n=1 Tax=Rhizobium mongolense TaxID=57676 RepID=A0A7W6WEB1_9HYPH|nr:hypothetical protein [Rhizobium mongolense]